MCNAVPLRKRQASFMWAQLLGQDGRAKLGTSMGKIPKGIEGLRNQLREVGLRATGPRMAVLRYLAQVGAPVSHAQVYEKVAAAGIDRATVYRNLVDLADAGLLRRSDLGDHVWRFELVHVAGSQTVHPHFVCTDCGTVACLPQESVELHAVRDAPKALRRQGLEIQVRGQCDACSGGA
jgi:Fur family ferric uptake transcriptional regulator